MRRREFTSLVLSAAMAWPLASRAQQSSRVLLIGVLMGFAENDPIAQSMVAAFRSALPKLGWTEGGQAQRDLRRQAHLRTDYSDCRVDPLQGTVPFCHRLRASDTAESLYAA
jgi:hypothetical protein